MPDDNLKVAKSTSIKSAESGVGLKGVVILPHHCPIDLSVSYNLNNFTLLLLVLDMAGRLKIL